MTTTAPSAVSVTSSSIPSAPCSCASRNAASVFSGASAEAPRWARIRGVRGYKSVSLELHKIALAGAIEQVLVHGRLDVEIRGNIEHLLQDVARVVRAQLAVALDVPFLQQVSQPLLVKGDLLGIGHAPEDFLVLLIGGVHDLNLVPDAPQEGFVHEVFGRKVG